MLPPPHIFTRKGRRGLLIVTVALSLWAAPLSATAGPLPPGTRFIEAPGTRVRGTVRDENGPVAGVTVREKGSDQVALTGEDGTYSLTVTAPDAVVVFSYVGYATREIPLEGRSVLDVTLEASSQALSGLVVTALGIPREKRSLGYSVGELSGKEMNRVPQENVLNAIAGKVAGVTVSQTGPAGSSVSMVIRGATSLSTDNQPLFVVDGVPIANTLNNISQVGTDNTVDFGNAISSINPDDIASVTILKGPSAAALYGSRAGNGVVLITTKTGKDVNRMTVTVSSSTVMDIPYRFLDWQTRFGSGQFSAIPTSLSGNLLTDPFGGLIQENVTATAGGELDKGYTAVQWNSPLDASGKPVALPLVSHPHNVRNFVQPGITSENSVSVANNTGGAHYRLSYSNMSNRGIVPHADLFRNTFDVNASVAVSSRLRLSTAIDLSRNNSDNRPAQDDGTNPLAAAYAVSPHIDIRDLKQYWEPGQQGLQQRTQYNGVFDNPYFLASEVKNS
jgi:TonB-dependent SusC/RagA subfamily outer membrane receptor